MTSTAKRRSSGSLQPSPMRAPQQSSSSQPLLPVPLTSFVSLRARPASLSLMEGPCRNINDFERLARVGEGTYGIVYKARDVTSGDIVAIKRVKMQGERGGLPQSTLREIMALRQLDHENIVRLLCVAAGRQLTSVFLVMEFCDYDLATLIDNMPTPFPEHAVKCLALQLFTGLEAMHRHFFIHRDVKLSNLLLNSRGILKLADMGLARPAEEPPRAKSPNVVTLWYRAPELLYLVPHYTSAVDMWSAGCVLGELLDHKPLLPGTSELQQLRLIVELVGTPHDGIWPGFSHLPLATHYRLQQQDYSNLKLHFGYLSAEGISLMQALLVYDPSRRITAEAAARHPYFRTHPVPCSPELLPVIPVHRRSGGAASSHITG